MPFVFIAFLGGLLSLLPACGISLLPGFFAYSFRQKGSPSGIAFFVLGFSVLFLPFSLGSTLVLRWLVFSRGLSFEIAGTLLILFGILSFIDFKLPIYLSGNTKSNSFVMGLSFGFTSSACIAPIYGAITTLGLVAQNLTQTLILLMAFEVGMFLPLIILALVFERWGFLRKVNKAFQHSGIRSLEFT